MCLFGIYSIFHQSLTTSEFLLQNMNVSSKIHHKSLPTYFLIFPIRIMRLTSIRVFKSGYGLTCKTVGLIHLHSFTLGVYRQ